MIIFILFLCLMFALYKLWTINARLKTLEHEHSGIEDAEQYAREKMDSADKDAEKVRAAANAYSEETKTAADAYAKEQRDSADTEAAEIKSDADQYAKQKKRESDVLLSNAKSDVEKVEFEIKALKEERKQLKSELASLQKQTVVEMVKIDPYLELRSDEIKNRMALLSNEEDEMIKSGKAVSTLGSLTGKALTTQTKQLLRCFNAEAEGIIDHLTVKNVDSARTRLQRAFDANNKIFAADGVALTGAFLSLKLEELSATYAYLLQVEEEKEQRRAIREQMVEEEKVRREIEREKKKIDKDRQQFSQEVQKLMGYMQKSQDDVEKQLYIDKIRELEEKLKTLEVDEKTVLERENNAKAGFVYIISNIGSFGDRVFKIGMTRRLEPMDRIAELSSASVPFPFDVHAMIFSEDAPALEAMLHQHFRADQVNKVNTRKEFFRVDLAEIKKLVLENFNNTVHFVDVPEATEYRETLRLEQEASASC